MCVMSLPLMVYASPFLQADPTLPSLPVMYGRSAVLESETLCCVHFEDKRPSLYDQIKLRLPSVLLESHHLVFKFCNVECRLNKLKGNDSAETVLGYAVFPVFPGRRVVQNGPYQLPVIVAPHHGPLPPHYLSAEGEQQLEYLDNQHPLFSFHTRLISTVYTHDPALDSWFHKPVTDGDCDLLKRAGSHRLLVLSCLDD